MKRFKRQTPMKYKSICGNTQKESNRKNLPLEKQNKKQITQNQNSLVPIRLKPTL